MGAVVTAAEIQHLERGELPNLDGRTEPRYQACLDPQSIPDMSVILVNGLPRERVAHFTVASCVARWVDGLH